MFMPLTSKADVQLLAGVAKADITPEPGLKMWGYSARSKPATGTIDPLMAKALVLKAGDQSVAIVSLDLGRTPTDPLLAKLRERTAKSCGVTNLFITASHTHSAPAVDAPAYGEKVIDAIEKIIIEAAGKLVPVRLGVGRTKADFAHNRRVILSDGRVAMLWRNAEKVPTKPLDHECGVIRLDRDDGTPLAILFHYACHPVVLGPDNLEYSADYVGAACNVVEDQMKTTCLFLQGACGDINPYMDKTPINQGGVQEMRNMGRAIGKLLVEAANKIESKSAPSASLKYERRQFDVGLRWDTKMFPGNSVKMDLTTLLINDQIALAGMPGEIFVQFQTELKDRSPVRDTFLVGYCNGYFGYFPTIRDAALGGYGGTTATFVSVGTGERLTNESLVILYKMTGKLSDTRRPEDAQILDYKSLKEKKQGEKAQR